MQTPLPTTPKTRPDLLLPGLALAKLIIHLLTSSQYGYFRDEFYYIAASKQLAFGYVDFPPFIALLTAFVRGTLGESQLALRLFPALAGAALVYLAGLMARELGANRYGQGLAALATLIAPQFLGAQSILTMDAFDPLVWSAAIYILILIFKYERPRLWLLFGLVVGLGLTIKISMLYFGLALVIGMALTAQRKQFRQPDLYTGGAIALAFLLPYLWWNSAHGWPTLEFFAGYGAKVYQASPLEFLLQQIIIMQPATLPLWWAGLLLLFSKKGESFRPLGWAYLILLLVFMLQHAKNYFLAPMYPVLFAAGGWQYGTGPDLRRFFGWKSRYVWILIVSGLISVPMVIPVLPLQAHLAYMRPMGWFNPASESHQTSQFPQHFADRFGWEEMAVSVAQVYHALPESEQGKACIFTDNYGEAGALEFYAKQYDLPTVVSGHNNYFLWGARGCSGELVILVNADDVGQLEKIFDSVQHAGWTDCQYCMPYEDGQPIYVGRGLVRPLDELWPSAKHFE